MCRQAIERTHSMRTDGFTLVEILIVVVILAILALIVVPQFTSATEESRESAAQMTLHRLRGQLELYRQQHHGDWPSLQAFEDQMTQATNAAGQTAAPGTPGYTYGPYLRRIPTNPFTGDNDVSADGVGDSAWYYNENTGEFRANHDADARAEW